MRHVGDQVADFIGYPSGDKGEKVRGEFAAFSPYGMFLATAHEHTVTFRSPKDGSELFTWQPDSPYGQRIKALRFDPNGNTLLAFLENAKPTKNPIAKFWQYDVESHQAWPFEGTHEVVVGRMTEDGKTVITWDGSPEIVFWDTTTGTESAALKVAPNHVYSVAFTPKADVIATAGDDDEVKFWKIADRTRLKTEHPFMHEGVDLIEFAPGGKHMITSSDNSWLKSWDAPSFCYDDRNDETVAGVSTDEHGVVTEQIKSTSKNRSTWSQIIPLLDNSKITIKERHPDGTVVETLPDGTEKKYKQH